VESASLAPNSIWTIPSRIPSGTHRNGVPPISYVVSRSEFFYSNNLYTSFSCLLPAGGVRSGPTPLPPNTLSTIPSFPGVEGHYNSVWVPLSVVPGLTSLHCSDLSMAPSYLLPAANAVGVRSRLSAVLGSASFCPNSKSTISTCP